MATARISPCRVEVTGVSLPNRHCAQHLFANLSVFPRFVVAGRQSDIQEILNGLHVMHVQSRKLFRREVFQYIKDGEELVEEPFRRLISEGQLLSYSHNKFWACMDTFKELQVLEDLYGRGKAPWAVWNGKH